MKQTISYDPFCVDGYLFIPDQEQKLTCVYNIEKNTEKNIVGLSPTHLEISALPKQVSLRCDEFDRQVFDILNKSGLYGSKKSLRNSFFTPFRQGKLVPGFDSSVLLRLTSAYFMWYLLNAKTQEIVEFCFEDLSYDYPEYRTFQVIGENPITGIEAFEKQILAHKKWLKDRIEFSEKIWGNK